MRARDWEYFEIDGTSYMVIANYRDVIAYAVDSKIYRWTGTSFTEFQSIPTMGAVDWEHFEIDGTHYIAVANSFDGASGGVDSKIYHWTGNSFVESQ
eukprot:CAMPEP_0115268252 /NCGR_PEP_ID=MMETSP0270-20121206/52422_1 /TAXON_ID=71861 /ORGANISM="Scrippsiella trochoidea, Strain CCMP3099" /LENGTH=96 /DNA_ID=CAMNT_0002684443 /DNA_START=167 /DNA_END=454 /DNA_ORIENTATION=-